MKKRIYLLIAVALLFTVFGVAIFSTETTTPEMTIEKNNLSYRDAICIKYAVISNVEGAEMLVWYSAPEGNQFTKATAEKTIEHGSHQTVSGVRYCIYDLTGIAAKQMTEDIYARTYYKVGDEEYYSPLKKFSVLEYAYLIKNGNYSEANVNAVTNLLNYGAAVQVLLGSNTERLANADFYMINIVDGMLPDTTDHGLYMENESLTFTALDKSQENKVFSHWENSAGENVGTTKELTVTVGAKDETYTAVYSSIGLDYTLSDDETYYIVSGIGTCTDTVVVIPNICKEKPVSEIDKYAFKDCNELVDIVIPDSVTVIGDHAFEWCGALENLEIPGSVVKIGEQAFQGCYSLESIVVDDRNTVYISNGNCLIETASKTLILGCKNSEIPADGSVVSISADSFSLCNELKSITIPDCVTYINGSAFYGCSGLEKITVSEGNTKYHSKDNCLIETSTKTLVLGCKDSVIPTDGGVTSIGNEAFSGHSPAIITIPNSVTTISDYAFYDCYTLSDISIPYSVKSIGSFAFVNCNNLSDLVIPNGVESIGESAFLGCTALANISIPQDITSISENIFAGCSSLTSITLTNNLTHIQDQAFYFCTNLADIHFLGTQAEWNAITKGSNWDSYTGNYTIHCTDGDIAK